MTLSVVVPTYNSAATIVRALDSLARQTRPVAEIIVSDDGSRDDTRAVVADHASRLAVPLRLVGGEANRGPSAARNAAFAAASTRYVALLDADDAWSPERADTLLALAERTQADLVVDNIVLHDLAAGTDIRLGLPKDRVPESFDTLTYWRNCEFGRFQYSLLKPVLNLSFLRAHKLAYDEGMRYGEDLIFYGELLAAGARAAMTPEAGYIYSVRIGAKSVNAASQSQPDFASIVRAVDAFLARHRDALAPDESAAVRRCRDVFAAVERSNAGRAARRRGDWLGYGRSMMDPRVLRLLATMRMRRLLALRPGYRP